MGIMNPAPLHFNRFSPLLTNENRVSGIVLRTTNSYVRNYKQNMQNKPNFKKTQMNVNTFITTSYEQRTMNYELKNKPNSNPNKPNSNPISAQKMPKLIQNKPNYRKTKMNENLFAEKNHKNETTCAI